jgi:hypothetical protein
MAIEFKTVRVEFDQTQGMLQTEPFSTINQAIKDGTHAA